MSVSGLRTRLTLLVLVVVVPLIGLTLVRAAKHYQDNQERVQAGALELARSVSMQHDSHIETTRQLLLALSLLPAVRNQQTEACNELVASLYAQYPQYTGFYVVNHQGDPTCSPLPFPSPLPNYADRPWFQRAMQAKPGTLALGEYAIGRMSGLPGIGVSLPIYEYEGGEVTAVIMAGLRLDWLSQYIASRPVPPGTVVRVIDRNGTVLVHLPDPEPWVGQPLPDAALLETVRAQGEGVTKTSLQGPEPERGTRRGREQGTSQQTYLTGFTPLSRNIDGAWVIVSTPQNIAFSEVNTLLQQDLLVLGLVTMVALGLTWAGGTWLVLRPITRLVEATRQLASGHLETRTGLPYTNDEPGHLAAAIDQMAASLQSMYCHMEDLVNERTADLSETNQALQAEIMERRRAEDALQQARSELEQRVTSRTAALFEANCVLQDEVAERRRVEEALRENQALLQDIIDHSPAYIFIKDTQGRVLLINRCLASLFDQSPDQMRGCQQEDLFPAERIATWKEEDQQVVASGAPLHIEEQYTGDGATFTHQVIKFPLYDKRGRVYAVGGISTDITEHKHIEARQATQLAVTRVLAEAATIGEAIPRLLQVICQGLDWQFGEMWQIHPTTSVLHRTALWSEPALAASAFACAAPSHTFAPGVGLPGRVWTSGQPDWVGEVTTDPHFARVEEAARAGLHSSFAFPVGTGENSEGVMCFFCQSTRPFDGVLSEMMADIGQQISQFLKRKRAEATLENERASLARLVEERTADLKAINVELGRAVRARDEFLAMMSHELRTPLHAILTLSESLQEGVYGSVSEKQSHSLRTIEESGRHLLDLINDILDIAKIEAGKVVLRPGPVVVETVCHASLKLVREAAQKKHLRLSHHFDETIQTMYADERRLKQILVNLLSNAVKFTPDGGSIGLEVRGDPSEGTVHFTVWDTGIGIDARESSLLFKPFVQIDSSLSRQYQGTGLGLVMVARLTDLHGGCVSLESAVGKGSRFTVSLPWQGNGVVGAKDGDAAVCHGLVCCYAERQGNATNHNHHVLSGGPVREGASPPLILLVDDNDTSITVMSDYLRSHGYQVVIARDGLEAIEQARFHRPALILMDIQMPVMDGMEAIRQIRAIPDLPAIPIIVLTSLAMPGDRERCLTTGASDYVSKPVSLQKLIQMVRQHLVGPVG
jgi:PAS domain S-box-containing protein